MSVLVAFFALGPGLFGYSLAYLIWGPREDWIAPAITLAISLGLTIVTQTLGWRRLRRILFPRYKAFLIAARWGGLAMGIIIFFMFYFLLLSPD